MLKKIFAFIFAVMAMTSIAMANPSVTYFYGNGCHFCEELAPWLENFITKNNIEITKYEIFDNRDNYQLFIGMLRARGFKPEQAGTPTLIIGDKVMVGAPNIKQALEDFVKSRGNEPIKVEPKEPKPQEPVAPPIQEPAKESPKAENVQKVHAAYYYGANCYHCKNLEPWIKETETKYKDTLVIDKYEVMNDNNNRVAYNEVMSSHKIAPEQRGTPTMIINGKVFIGGADIKKGFDAEYPRALEKLNEKKAEPTQEITGGLPEVSAILLAAAADSVNPCAMMVLIILMASLLAYHKDDMMHVAAVVSSFIAAVFITYFSLGLGIVNIMTSTQIANKISMLVGIIAIIIGLMNLKDAFFYHAGGFAVEIPEKWKSKLTTVVTGITSPIGAFAAGAVVTMFELPCTGGPYLFGLSLIAMQASIAERILYLGLYNLVFISPLIAIAILCGRGAVALEQAEEFRNNNLKTFRIITGLIMAGGGIWLAFLR